MQKKSFTLIEMLIVVVIIGILAAALIPRLQSVQARARDTKRKADLHQIATALEIYKQDNWSYVNIGSNHGTPPYAYSNACSIDNTSTMGNACDDKGTLRNELSRYMTSIPKDSDQTKRYTPGNEITSYAFVSLPRKWSPFKAALLGARTETAGSSSNWVTNMNVSWYWAWVQSLNSGLPNDWFPLRSDASHSPVNTTDGTDQRDWSLYGNTSDMTDISMVDASLYEKNMCTTVVLTWGLTTNDGNGNCTANQDGNELRYIYVE